MDLTPPPSQNCHVVRVIIIIIIPRTHNSFGGRSFSAVGPRVRNDMPSHLRQDKNL